MRPRDFGLAALASYRVVRLITTDSLLDGAREQVFNRWPPTFDRSRQRWVPEQRRLVMRAPDDNVKVVHATALLDCPWCAGFWVSAIAAALLCHSKGEGVIVTLALSTCVGLLAGVDHALS